MGLVVFYLTIYKIPLDVLLSFYTEVTCIFITLNPHSLKGVKGYIMFYIHV